MKQTVAKGFRVTALGRERLWVTFLDQKGERERKAPDENSPYADFDEISLANDGERPFACSGHLGKRISVGHAHTVEQHAACDVR